MRVPIIAGNWKMHKSVQESAAFARELAPRLAEFSSVERIVAPTFLALHAVAEALRDSDIGVSSQDAHYEAQGAFTSQVSSAMLAGIAQYTIIGHSECRAYLAETDERVNLKLKAALACGLKPIVAVGEDLQQYEAGATQEVVGGQLRAALQGIDAASMADVILAYEPVWAIGTGRNASAALAGEVIGGCVRATVAGLFGDEVAQQVRIQYGGSVKPGNMAKYMAQPEIDGALVGGASLDVEDFIELVAIAFRVKGERTASN